MSNQEPAFPREHAAVVLVAALREARKALDQIDATACCSDSLDMNSSRRRYAIARDARIAIDKIDRALSGPNARFSGGRRPSAGTDS